MGKTIILIYLSKSIKLNAHRSGEQLTMSRLVSEAEVASIHPQNICSRLIVSIHNVLTDAKNKREILRFIRDLPPRLT
jgi:hypothetical protein